MVFKTSQNLGKEDLFKRVLKAKGKNYAIEKAYNFRAPEKRQNHLNSLIFA